MDDEADVDDAVVVGGADDKDGGGTAAWGT